MDSTQPKFAMAHRVDVKVPSSAHGQASRAPQSQDGPPQEGSARRKLRQQPVAAHEGRLQGCLRDLAGALGFKCGGQPLGGLRILLARLDREDGGAVCIPPV